MRQVASKNRREQSRQPSYLTDLEYLSDELRRLDLLIRIKVPEQSGPPSPLDQLKGLVISEEEVGSLLATSPLDASQAKPDRRPLLDELAELDSLITERRHATLQSGRRLSLARLSQTFSLTPFDERCILVCLAPELDRKYEKLFGYLHDDVTRRKPTVDLLLGLLCETAEEKLAARAAFDPAAPLIKFRLLQMADGSTDGPAPLLSRSVKLDDRIVNFLLGLDQIDSRLEPLTRVIAPRSDHEFAAVVAEIKRRAANFVRSHLSDEKSSGRNLVFHLSGAYGSDARALATAICGELGVRLLVADLRKMTSASLGFEEAVWLLGRESLLQPAALCLENLDHLAAEDGSRDSELKAMADSIRSFSRLTFLAGGRPWKPHEDLIDQVLVSLEFPLPGDGERKVLWEQHARGRYRISPDVDFGALASKFRFTSRQIGEALNLAQSVASWRAPDDGAITMEDLHTACRAQSSPKLGRLARKVEPRYAWADIVLPEDQLAQLSEVCNQARYRHVVYGEWGFDRKLSLGKGLNVLFSGPPGTGKTMAAEVIASELQLDLFKIDLSQVVSKYIGDTEKNLHNIFHEAQASGAILFFDEADALFGKRSEVKDAHDRYANIEIGYLLQKMEEYDGIAVLATNLRQNLDEAFVRRMHFILEFPFPDEEYRRRIWEVVFPHEAPVGDDVDFNSLARDVRLAGGNIKNIALAAAFFAASDGKVIRMPHLTRAARREFQKLGRTWNEGGHGAQSTSAH
ncbi:MAG TPA: ATP-binding protein [Blastocatellia bacterium]|nr:ATP-binding protein [Blastocatellia bacterium]